MHETSEYISLADAAKLAPGRPSTHCLWRWCRRGVMARNRETVRLQHVRMGGKIYTTPGWLAEFGQSLADADTSYFRLATGTSASMSRPRSRSEKQQQSAVERAERKLMEAGA